MSDRRVRWERETTPFGPSGEGHPDPDVARDRADGHRASGVATCRDLVAGGATPAEVFEAVIAEVGQLVPADVAGLSRFERDDTITVIGA
jgi:hypothetical protein